MSYRYLETLFILSQLPPLVQITFDLGFHLPVNESPTFTAGLSRRQQQLVVDKSIALYFLGMIKNSAAQFYIHAGKDHFSLFSKRPLSVFFLHKFLKN